MYMYCVSIVSRGIQNFLGGSFRSMSHVSHVANEKVVQILNIQYITVIKIYNMILSAKIYE